MISAASWRRQPWGLLSLGVLVAAALAVPLLFLVVEAQSAGVHNTWGLIDRPLTGDLLWNTLRLAVAVCFLTTVIGVGTAWLVERTNLPGGRLWSVLLVVPLAIPDFVTSWGWASLSKSISGFNGAVLVMTLAVYPLVYLPSASSFRNSDPALEEVARSLGVSRRRTFWSVTLGQARFAILGGCLLVLLLLFAEYGAFEVVGYQTFTTKIFGELNQSHNYATASALSLVIVVLGLAAVTLEAGARGRGRVSRADRFAQRTTGRHDLGPWTAPALLAVGAVVVLALGVPIGSGVHWWISGPTQELGGNSMIAATLHTFTFSGGAALISTAAALPMAILAVRHDGAARRMMERSTYLVLAMPGLVIALAISHFSEQYLGGLWYQTAPMLMVTYAIMYFPLALVGVRASVAQAPRGLEDVGRSLGQSRLAVLTRVTLPLVAPGIAAAFCLVFLSAVTELTATLLLKPTGVDTLATDFWNYQQNLAYGQAAPFALLMIAIAALPSYVLGRYFDRLPTKARAHTVEEDMSVSAIPTGSRS